MEDKPKNRTIRIIEAVLYVLAAIFKWPKS